jgi:hypothetical protein
LNPASLTLFSRNLRASNSRRSVILGELARR